MRPLSEPNIKLLSDELIPRTSPCVWTQPVPERLETYVQDGFLINRWDVPKKVQTSVPLWLERLQRSNYPGQILERDGIRVRSQFDIHNCLPEVLQSFFPPNAVDLAQEILGGEPLIYQSHINFKLAEVGGAYDWHSDYIYWRDQDGMLTPRAISVIIPLEKHNETNGGVKLLKGSHSYYYKSHLSKKAHWTPDQILHDPAELSHSHGLLSSTLISNLDFGAIASPSLDLGDYLIMDANTWHFSGENKSSSGRATLFVILVSAETHFDDSLKGHRPHYISCRKGYSIRRYLSGI